MPTRRSPSLPTQKQIRDVQETVAEMHPNARILSIGPNGITFEYPDAAIPIESQWRGKPFSAANS